MRQIAVPRPRPLQGGAAAATAVRQVRALLITPGAECPTCRAHSPTAVVTAASWLSTQPPHANPFTTTVGRMDLSWGRGRCCGRHGGVVQHAAPEEVGHHAKAVRRVAQLREELVLHHAAAQPSARIGLGLPRPRYHMAVSTKCLLHIWTSASTEGKEVLSILIRFCISPLKEKLAESYTVKYEMLDLLEVPPGLAAQLARQDDGVSTEAQGRPQR